MMNIKDELTKTQVRIPNDLLARLKSAAENSGRSMNAEIIHRLEMSLEKGVIDIVVHADKSITLQDVSNILGGIKAFESLPSDCGINLSYIPTPR